MTWLVKCNFCGKIEVSQKKVKSKESYRYHSKSSSFSNYNYVWVSALPKGWKTFKDYIGRRLHICKKCIKAKKYLGRVDIP
jgi:hypothetical protein